MPLVVLERVSSILLEASNISCSLTLRSRNCKTASSLIFADPEDWLKGFFNVVIFSSPFGPDSPHGSVVLEVASRYGFQDHNVSDAWRPRYFLDETEIFDSPEDVTPELRKYFA